jgi:hypothetical protein
MSGRNIKTVGTPEGHWNERKHVWDCVFFDHPKQSILMCAP